VEAQIGVAKAHIGEGAFADAIKQLDPLAKSQPSNAEVFELLGQAYAGMGNKQEAQRAQDRANLLRKKKPQ
jgi:predicted Zn-dependent protease